MACKYAFLGAGNMAEAFSAGLLRAGLAEPGDLIACDVRPKESIAWLAQQGIGRFLPALEAVKAADAVVVSVKPKDVQGLLEDLAKSLDAKELEGKCFMSIAAGVGLGKIEGFLSPAKARVIRMMPNIPVMVGQGASAYSLGAHANAQDASLADAMLKSLGVAVRVEESQMDAVTALSGSGPAYVFLFMEALLEGARKLGLDEPTRFLLAAQTLKGAAEMIMRQQDSPARLREKVTSPGGTTAAALARFEQGALKSLVAEAMQAAALRSAEIGR
jgi:pyrroline-5-carboxylate reductase